MGETFAAVDKFDQCLSYIQSSDKVGKKYLRLFRWIMETGLTHTHSLVCEWTFEEGSSSQTAVTTLRQVQAAFVAEQEVLKAEFGSID